MLFLKKKLVKSFASIRKRRTFALAKQEKPSEVV